MAGTINSSGGGAQTFPGTINLNNGTLTGVANGTFGAFLTDAAYTIETSPGNVSDSPASVTYTFPGGPAASGKRFARLKVTGP